MRSTAAVALVMAAALASCSKPTPGRSNAATASGANGAATASTSAPAPSGAGSGAVATALNPGQWETAIEMKMAGLPANAPPEAAKAMQGMKTVTRLCLTPEKAAKPSGDLFSGKPQEGCSHQEFAVTGGRLHGALTCKGASGATSTITMDGQYGGDSFDVTMTMTGNEGGRSATYQTHSVGHRIAPTCSGAKDD
jgi:hypothetical protein